ncbi:F-box/kelch-repeat protein-like [Dorcoceras hygrometricum]|uniref:F-box/kelch-repeat protein-like n=1 Tax=Dorcoceras hygrometricum TaxID=472368 RepID=A0A2Z7D041_9LAMI|nr:F-box/kelch-repeat protein-like [Dorcoceras hygrometricum]
MIQRLNFQNQIRKKAYCPEPIATAQFLRIRSPPSRIFFSRFRILASIHRPDMNSNGLQIRSFPFTISFSPFVNKTTNFGPNPTVPYIEDAYEMSVVFISMQRLKISTFVTHFK